MDKTKIFPVLLMTLDVCACYGDIRKTIYWIAAAVLNAAVTF